MCVSASLCVSVRVCLHLCVRVCESVCACVSASLCISVSDSVCVHVSASLCVSESVCVPRVGAADSCPLKSAPPWRKRGTRRVQYGAERPAFPLLLHQRPALAQAGVAVD